MRVRVKRSRRLFVFSAVHHSGEVGSLARTDLQSAVNLLALTFVNPLGYLVQRTMSQADWGVTFRRARCTL